MKKLLLLLILALAPLAAHAETTPPAGLSPRQINDLKRVELYLNGLRTVTSDFLQVDDAGGMMHGEIKISRPGKMRVTYSSNGDFIVADGTFVHIWDDSLKNQTNVEQGSSLAEFILRDPVKLSGDVTVTQFHRYPNKIEVSLVQTKDPAAGSLTLVFEDNPLKLRQWKVMDAQGRTTGVDLQNMTEGMTFPGGTFTFVPPDFAKNP